MFQSLLELAQRREAIAQRIAQLGDLRPGRRSRNPRGSGRSALLIRDVLPSGQRQESPPHAATA